MTLKDEVTKYIQDTFSDAWTTTEPTSVPENNIGLGNDARKIDATVLYADLTDSTGLVKQHSDGFAAEVYKTFVFASVKAIRYEGGSVTAYDGDRVMGVFMGGQMRNDATRAAFRISGIVQDVLQPELEGIYKNGYKVRHKVGIDRSPLFVANTGIRGNNDFVWVGNAANNAAKMAALAQGYTTYITHEVFAVLAEKHLTHGDGTKAWTDLGSADLGFRIYGANSLIGS